MQYVSLNYNYNQELADNWELLSIDSTAYANEEQPLIDYLYEKSTIENSLLIRQKTFYSYNEISLVKNQDQNDYINIYPNPATDFINIQVNEPDNSYLQIYSLAGQLILQKIILNVNTRVNTNNLKPGNYLLKVNTNSKTHSQLIVIK